MRKGVSNRKQQIEEYYVEFINKLICKEGKKINKIQQLSNGVCLGDILSDVNIISSKSLIFGEQQSFVSNLTNLKCIMAQIDQYWRQNLKLAWQDEIDLVVAAKENSQEIIKLVRLIIRTLFLSPSKDQFIQKILETSQNTQQFFMQLVNTQTNQSQFKRADDNKNGFLYRKLEEVERQNERLVKIIEEMQNQFLHFKEREKQNEQRLKQNEKQIFILNEEIKVLRISAYQNQQELLQKQQNQVLQDNLQENSEQFKERQQKILYQIQQLRDIISNQAMELKSLTSIKVQFNELKSTYGQTIRANMQLGEKLSQTLEKLQSVQNQLKFSQQTVKENDSQIQTLKQTLIGNEKTIHQKYELIEQLQNNIKYLLQCEPKPSTNQHEINTQKTTLKQQCQSAILTSKQHLILTKLTQENLTLNRQLKLKQQINLKLEDQLQKMSVCKEENQKLVQMINHMHKYRGQENELLIKTIYQMRLKLLKNQLKPQQRSQQHPLKTINRHY